MTVQGTATTRDCIDPWTYFEVRVNGGVAPCCVRPEIANLQYETLTDALDGAAIRHLRLALLQGSLDAACGRCQQRPRTSPLKLQQRVRDLLATVKPPAQADLVQFHQHNPGASPETVAAWQHACKAARLTGGQAVEQRPTLHHLPFDAAAYLEANPDVAAAGEDALAYLLRQGMTERRRMQPAGRAYPTDTAATFPFDAARYLALNPDVVAGGANPLVHFMRHGRMERRRLR